MGVGVEMGSDCGNTRAILQNRLNRNQQRTMRSPFSEVATIHRRLCDPPSAVSGVPATGLSVENIQLIRTPRWFGFAAEPLDTLRQTCQFELMAKFRSSYVCQNCGAVTQRWQGKCESCGEWNTIVEEAAALGVGGAALRKGAAGRPFPLEDLSGDSKSEPRVVT